MRERPNASALGGANAWNATPLRNDARSYGIREGDRPLGTAEPVTRARTGRVKGKIPSAVDGVKDKIEEVDEPEPADSAGPAFRR